MRSLIALSITRRTLTTSTKRLARPRDVSASQPVLKRDAPAAPSPPARPIRPASPTSPPTPTPEPRASARGGKPGSILASYKALPYNTKLVFWACGAMFATLGLLVADKLEELFPARNNRRASTEADPETRARFINHKDQERKPKLFSVSVVDRST